MNIMKYIATIAVVALMAMIAVGCGSKVKERPIVTVSIQPQKFFLEKIVGEKMEVKCLLASGGNPETYEPAITHLVNLEKSEAYFCIGNIGFEAAIIDKVHANNPDLKIYNNSEGIALIVGTHGHSYDGHSYEVDPHTWSSVKNAKTIATNMYKAIADIDPSNQSYYAKRYDAFMAELDSLDSHISQMLAPKRDAAFLVWHPSLSYFARDYGLHQISIGVEGKESSVQSLQHQIEHAREDSVQVFFFQKGFDSRQAQVINEQIGAEMISINPLNYYWDEEMLSIASAIASK